MLATQICQLAVDCILNDFQRAVRIDTQQSRRAVVDAMKTITRRDRLDTNAADTDRTNEIFPAENEGEEH
ncbi:hypothetical protein T01_6382 [Trichinella spiralis]|uniref:Uncharacterized protein n=1 Tax=Trichinella spiralis TaxID=6334 RepID=A0A0V1BGU5_TRISP|nr:hypothetical protein T01_6382 [Trichinella spiralis]